MGEIELTEQEQPEPQEQPDLSETGPDPALIAAIERVRLAGLDPVALAQANRDLEADIRGAYVVIKVLLTEYVGVGVEKVIPRPDWMATNPHEHVQTRVDDEGSIRLTVIHTNRSERRGKTTRAKA